jgi:hypothetical protein
VGQGNANPALSCTNLDMLNQKEKRALEIITAMTPDQRARISEWLDTLDGSAAQREAVGARLDAFKERVANRCWMADGSGI